MSKTESLPPRRWMGPLLLAAAIYNITWGLWVITFPVASYRISGYTDPLAEPSLWQCIGMIVGVYGIGYGIAATNPFRHWPLVLVGLIGKVLGPIGMAYTIWQGTLPLSAARTIVFNDLIWWIPFAIIIWEGIRTESNSTTGSQPVPSFDDAVRQFHSQNGISLFDLSQQQPTLVVFLRHAGCTFCREALADLATQRSRIEATGTGLALVHMSPEQDAAPLMLRYHLEDVPRFSDPEQVLFRAFELRLGRFRDLFGWSVLRRGFRAAILEGHGFGGLQGNGLRMPGVFLLHQGRVVRGYRHETAADRPDYTELACPLP